MEQGIYHSQLPTGPEEGPTEEPLHAAPAVSDTGMELDIDNNKHTLFSLCCFVVYTIF